MKDISNISKHHPDASQRLCLLLGARKAIRLMDGVKHAPEKVYLLLNITKKVKSLKNVKRRVIKEIEIQGYDYEFLEDFGDVFAIQTIDRKYVNIIIEPEENSHTDEFEEEDEEEVNVNVFNLSGTQLRDFPSVVTKRGASIKASLGASITSLDIIQFGTFMNKQEVVIQDLHHKVIAHGIAEMDSSEIRRSPRKITIKTLEGRYDQFSGEGHKRYKAGLYSITTLPRILGIKNLRFRPKVQANIFVHCPDDGVVAVALSKQMPKGSKIFVMLRDEEHQERIKATLKRLEADVRSFDFIDRNISTYSKSRPRIKFSHCFVEFASSRSGHRPNPFFEAEEQTIINHAREQYQGVRALALLCVNEAQISYVSHSLDPTEHQEIMVSNFRQGSFTPLILEKSLLDKYPAEFNVIPEITNLNENVLTPVKLRSEELHRLCWLNVDPLIHNSHAGVVGYFQYTSLRRNELPQRRTVASQPY